MCRYGSHTLPSGFAIEDCFKGRVLILDDDPTIGPFYQKILSNYGFRCDICSTIDEMRTRLSTASFDFVLLDMNLGNEQRFNGLALILKEAPFTKVYVLTADGSVERAVEAMLLGASGFFQKSGKIELLIAELTKQTHTAAVAIGDNLANFGLIGQSHALQEVVEKIHRLKDIDSMILIQGESGTGKEVVARAIHGTSARAKHRFDAINCAAIPEALLESELFGHKRGAFTDAKSDRKGIFELCSNGTLLLDEIGDMPLSLQVKILRVLQEHEIIPVGSSDAIKVNTRVIAATHRDILVESRAKRFREDLYYRLSIIVLKLPALRERVEDIPLLVEHYLGIFNRRFKREVKLPGWSVMNRMLAYEWPGNIRELQNSLERSIVLSVNDQIDIQDVFAHLSVGTVPIESHLEASPVHEDKRYLNMHLTEAKQAFERSYLENQLRNCKGQVLEVAERAGRYRADIYRLLNRYGLDQSQFKS